MVSPGKLRALSELKDGDNDAFEPSVSETGAVTYPTVEQHLDGQDSDRTDFLETMTDRGVLESDFEYKVYICPHCAVEGMQYSTGCPDCGSVHAIEEPAAVHPNCGTPLGHGGSKTATESQDDTAEDLYCADCDEDVSVESLESDHRYWCHDCDLWFDAPTHRLWCRDCNRVYPPADVTEEPLVRYPLTSFGRRWVTEQLERRQLLAETFEERGYETSIDTTIPTSTSEELPVHVYAVDELFDARIVAGVHDSPTVTDGQRLVEAAREADAQPLLLLTNGAVDERVSEVLDTEDVTVVSGSDGTLSNEYDIHDRTRNSNSISEWLGSVFSSSAKR